MALVVGAVALHREAGTRRRVAAMEQVRLGGTGLHVSRICLGMMSYGEPACAGARGRSTRRRPSRSCGERSRRGVTFFDTADMYSDGASEESTGRLLREAVRHAARSTSLATKVYFPMGAGPERRGPVPQARPGGDRRVAAAAGAGLRRPVPDPPLGSETPIEETMEALHDVVRAGKARYLGARSMYAWQFAKAQHAASRRLDAVRVDAEPLQPGLPGGGAGDDPAAASTRASACMPWSPLARGLLAGTRTRSRRAAHDAVRQTDPFADELYGRRRTSTSSSGSREVAAERGAAARAGRAGVAAATSPA